MSITNWPLNERPREKLLHQGANTLSDAELLAIFIRTGTRGKTAVDLARDLLNHFGSLRALLSADLQQFCHHHGLGIAKYAQLQASLEIGKRHLQETIQRHDVLETFRDTRNYLTARLRDYKHEVFACLLLDNRHRVIAYEELFHGTINSSVVHPREVVKCALKHNAAAIIISHNHPSGIAEPSRADELITQQLNSALRVIDVRLLDHIIIGEGQITSLAERGMLN